MSNSSKEAFLNSVRLREMWDNHLYADLMLIYLIQRPWGYRHSWGKSWLLSCFKLIPCELIQWLHLPQCCELWSLLVCQALAKGVACSSSTLCLWNTGDFSAQSAVICFQKQVHHSPERCVFHLLTYLWHLLTSTILWHQNIYLCQARCHRASALFFLTMLGSATAYIHDVLQLGICPENEDWTAMNRSYHVVRHVLVIWVIC